MSPPRVRLRTLMIAVAVAALIVWLAAPAVTILRDPGRRWLIHIWERPDGRYLHSGHEVSFLARYRRGLLGSAWPCRSGLCKENAAAYREIDSGRPLDAMWKDHPYVLGSRRPPE